MRIEPLTPERFPDLATLFDQGGDPKWCWCSYFRARGRDWTNSTAAENRAVLEAPSRRARERPLRRAWSPTTSGAAVGWVEPRAARGLRAARATRSSSPRSTTPRSGRSSASSCRAPVARPGRRARPPRRGHRLRPRARRDDPGGLPGRHRRAAGSRPRTPTTARSRCSSGPASRSSSAANGTRRRPVRPIVRPRVVTTGAGPHGCVRALALVAVTTVAALPRRSATERHRPGAAGRRHQDGVGATRDPHQVSARTRRIDSSWRSGLDPRGVRARIAWHRRAGGVVGGGAGRPGRRELQRGAYERRAADRHRHPSEVDTVPAARPRLPDRLACRGHGSVLRGGGSNDDERRSSTDALRPTRSAHAGDLCPSRASRRRQDRLPDKPRAVGQIGPPAFLMPFPAPPARTKEHHEPRGPPDDSVGRGPRLVPCPAPSTRPAPGVPP